MNYLHLVELEQGERVEHAQALQDLYDDNLPLDVFALVLLEAASCS